MFCSLGVLFACFWSCQWLSGITGLATSMSACRWFFSRNKASAADGATQLV